ncbi:alpha/beta hydrolase-fold protein [Streptomyces sp. SID13031]|uniref:alpha/beta hydrolase n=1 Tax=Streptomyces sp. SID13031 TaxID=2706046 RepID=UPI0013C83E6F|nr:alpha/beta hydrolase-fold protein [Streptomyces sp. SID13031]NEA31470.1 esterase [Streptomyces sp. SID13031]
MTRSLSRRTFLLTGAAAGVAGVAAVGLVETGAVPGRTRLHDVLGLTGDDGVAPDVEPGPVESGSFESAARSTKVGWSVIYPNGQQPDAALPVVLMLHGRGGDHTSSINDLNADRYLTAAVQAGTVPFALAAVDGGPDNYWHRRASGDDPQRMLMAEFLPLLKKRGLRTERFGVLGWSMGGYGALLLAAEQGATRVAAAGAMSPALWHKASQAAAGAYDGPDDFQQHQVFGRAADLKDVALRIDCGRDDPFAGAVRDLRGELGADGGIQAGAHTNGYWRRMLDGQLAFLGTKISD